MFVVLNVTSFVMYQMRLLSGAITSLRVMIVFCVTCLNCVCASSVGTTVEFDSTVLRLLPEIRYPCAGNDWMDGILSNELLLDEIWTVFVCALSVSWYGTMLDMSPGN